MKHDHVRYAVAATMLWFALGGSNLGITPKAIGILNPPPIKPAVILDEVGQKQLDSAKADLVAIVAKMLPADRQYMACFYDAVAYVVEQDGGRSLPVIGDSEKFAIFHAGSLQLAIEKKAVGKYPGLDTAIDRVYLAICGADVGPLADKAAGGGTRREKFVQASQLLAWVFRVRNG